MKPDLNTIGIVGGGQMGRGIAQVCAHAGYTVRIFDTNEAQLVLAQEEIRKSLQKAADKGDLPAVDTVMGRLETVSELSALHDCDFVIESATENEAVKREILRALSEIVQPDAFFRDKHLIDIDHPFGLMYRSAGKIHRHALYESRPADPACRSDSRACDIAGDVRIRLRPRAKAGKNNRDRRRFPCIHCQSDFDADD